MVTRSVTEERLEESIWREQTCDQDGLRGANGATAPHAERTLLELKSRERNVRRKSELVSVIVSLSRVFWFCWLFEYV